MHELEARFSNSSRRAELLTGLREALVVLERAGCRTVYLDGSFVTAKDRPGDFDAEPGGTRFLEFFQRDRETGQQKGIVKLDLVELA